VRGFGALVRIDTVFETGPIMYTYDPSSLCLMAPCQEHKGGCYTEGDIANPANKKFCIVVTGMFINHGEATIIYDPQLGKWAEVDIISRSGGKSHWYAQTGNDHHFELNVLDKKLLRGLCRKLLQL